MTGEAPDIRAQEDCPSADVCGSACDQHQPSTPAPSDCTCYPGGFTPDSYEGPQRDCPVHGEPSTPAPSGGDAPYTAPLAAISEGRVRPGLPARPASSDGDALTDDERRMFDAEFVRDFLGRVTDIGYGDRNRIAWYFVDYFAARAAQPPTPPIDEYDNHHNAALCPYCTPEPAQPPTPTAVEALDYTASICHCGRLMLRHTDGDRYWHADSRLRVDHHAALAQDEGLS